MLRRLGSALTAVLLAITVAIISPPVATAAPATPVTAPSRCPQPHPWPAGAPQRAVVAQLARTTGIRLVGPDWRDPAYLPMIRVVWQTLDVLACTDYLRHIAVLHPDFTLNAAPISGWAWGDWGLTRRGAVTLDFAKWRRARADHDDGRMVRLLVHELAHAWATDRGTSAYWATYQHLEARLGAISAYGARAATENFSEIVGYYVGRCARNNPYDTGRYAAYYGFVRQTVFGGREFGPAPGRAPDCSEPGSARIVPSPVSGSPAAGRVLASAAGQLPPGELRRPPGHRPL